MLLMSHGNAHRRRFNAAAVAAVLALLGGCHKKPGGQVLAVVNSDEITQQEIRAEADAAGIPADQDLQTYAPAILNRIIERDLLASYARKHGLDRKPDYVARRRQVEQTLLATTAERDIASSQPVPTDAQAQAFIKNNPATFAGRQRLTLDQLRFPTPQDRSLVQALVATGSIDAAIARLRAAGLPFQRGVSALDTGTSEPAVAKQIVALPNGKPFDVTINGTTFLSSITARTPIATPPDKWVAQAKLLMSRDAARKALVDAVGKLRSEAKIEYDPAFKPKAG